MSFLQNGFVDFWIDVKDGQASTRMRVRSNKQEGGVMSQLDSSGSWSDLRAAPSERLERLSRGIMTSVPYYSS